MPQLSKQTCHPLRSRSSCTAFLSLFPSSGNPPLSPALSVHRIWSHVWHATVSVLVTLAHRASKVFRGTIYDSTREESYKRAGTKPHVKLLIANRGEITRRVIRSAKSLGIPTVVVFTEPDALSLHVKDGDEAVCLSSSPKDYTNANKLLKVMQSTGYTTQPMHGITSTQTLSCCVSVNSCSAHVSILHLHRNPLHNVWQHACNRQHVCCHCTKGDLACRCYAVHPGYGFLSESAEFVDICEKAGIAFLGPRADTMRLFSRKHDARAFAQNAKVPILAGTHLNTIAAVLSHVSLLSCNSAMKKQYQMTSLKLTSTCCHACLCRVTSFLCLRNIVSQYSTCRDTQGTFPSRA